MSWGSGSVQIGSRKNSGSVHSDEISFSGTLIQNEVPRTSDTGLKDDVVIISSGILQFGNERSSNSTVVMPKKGPGGGLIFRVPVDAYGLLFSGNLVGNEHPAPIAGDNLTIELTASFPVT